MIHGDKVLTSAQMREVESRAIARGEVTGLELMERAGAGVVAAIREEWPEWRDAPQRAIILCGPGNNGGDGFVVARLLHDAGWRVTVLFHGQAAQLPPDARVNHDRWIARGGETCPYRPGASWLFQAELLVDALFGIGLSRPLEGLEQLSADFYEAAHNCFAGPHSPGIDAFVAVDVPSGVNADTGEVLGDAEMSFFAPDLTVTFHLPKTGHLLNRQNMGKLKVVDIGLRPFSGDGPVVLEASVRPDRLGKDARAHKYDHGHALILSGGPGRGGAARLAAHAALRVGAGLVTLAPPSAALSENAARLDAIMLRVVDDGEGLAQLLRDDRLSALALGPGLGLERASELVPVALAAGRATVLDADALTAFADDPASLFRQLHDRCALTPHDGEFARLFPDIAARLAEPSFSRLDAVREASARAGCAILLKGPATVIWWDNTGVIHSPEIDQATPWLATAGAGDVLTGLIAGLMARGWAAENAAADATWLHAAAARRFGPGLVATDLPEQIPGVLRDLGV